MKNWWNTLLERVGLKKGEIDSINYVQSYTLLDRADLFKYMDVWRQDDTKSSLAARHKRALSGSMFVNYDTLIVFNKAIDPDVEVAKLRECLGYVGELVLPRVAACPVRIRTKGVVADATEVMLTFRCGNTDAVSNLRDDIQDDVEFDALTVYTTLLPRPRYRGLGPGHVYSSKGIYAL